MTKLILTFCLLVSFQSVGDSLTVEYCPTAIDTENSIKAKLSRLADDKLETLTVKHQNMLVEQRSDTNYIDTRLLSTPPTIQSVKYKAKGNCKLGVYSYTTQTL